MVAALMAAVSLTLIEGVFTYLLEGSFVLNFHLWNLLAKWLISGVLGYYITINCYQSNKLRLQTFTVLYVIGNFNILVEALIFNVMDQTETIHAMLAGIPLGLIESFVLVFFFQKFTSQNDSLPHFIPRKTLRWIGRILAANFIYIFFYIIAGALLERFTPGFRAYYEDKIPPVVVVLGTNMFFRGFVFVGIAILIDRTTRAPKWTKAMLTGLVFAIVGGIAPLIPPNEYMPYYIRLAHSFEVGISNFLYGICTLLIVRSKIVNN